jgi:tetratricopeptide (TPR) repeat protein
MTKLRAMLVLALVRAPLSAVAGTKAQAHVAKAMEAHKAGRFADALVELKAAYALEPKPDLLFAIGQINVKLERCDEAIDYYEKYLATKPSAQAQSDTQQAIDTCKAQIAAAQPPPPPPPGSDSPFLPASSGPHDTSARSPWYKDKIGDALVIGGAAATVVGLVLYVGARGDLDDAESASSVARYDELVDSAHSKRTWSVVMFGGGAVLVGAGVVRYMMRGGSSKETRGVGMVPAAGGGLVTWAGQF